MNLKEMHFKTRFLFTYLLLSMLCCPLKLYRMLKRKKVDSKGALRNFSSSHASCSLLFTKNHVKMRDLILISCSSLVIDVGFTNFYLFMETEMLILKPYDQNRRKSQEKLNQNRRNKTKHSNFLDANVSTVFPSKAKITILSHKNESFCRQ